MRALPRRAGSAISSSTAGCARAASAEPSREPLSSTSTSVANGRPRPLARRSRRGRAAAARAGRCSRRRRTARSRASLILALLAAAYRLGPCASTSSTPRPTRRPTTTPSCSALGRAGADVELYTSRFAYGPVPRRRGLRAARVLLPPRPRRAGVARAAAWQSSPSTCPTCCATAARAMAPAGPTSSTSSGWRSSTLDGLLLPRRGRQERGAQAGLVLTAHDVLPREPRPGQLAAQRRLYGHFDAIVVHSEHGRGRLVEELGVDARARPRDPPRGLLAPRRPSRPGRRPHRERAARRALLRPPASLQGTRRPARGLAGGRRRRALDRRDGRAWTRPACGRRSRSSTPVPRRAGSRAPG